jgi:hypothetical protein
VFSFLRSGLSTPLSLAWSSVNCFLFDFSSLGKCSFSSLSLLYFDLLFSSLISSIFVFSMISSFPFSFVVTSNISAKSYKYIDSSVENYDDNSIALFNILNILIVFFFAFATSFWKLNGIEHHSILSSKPFL